MRKKRKNIYPSRTRRQGGRFEVFPEEELEEGKQGVMVVAQNPIAQLQARFKNLENGFRAWLAKQTLPVEATVVTATSAAQGAAIGAFMGTLMNDATSAFPTPPPQANLNPQAMTSFKQAQVFFFFSFLLIEFPLIYLFTCSCGTLFRLAD